MWTLGRSPWLRSAPVHGKLIPSEDGGLRPPPALSDRVLPAAGGQVTVALHAQLSQRELDILRRLAGGEDAHRIAEQLGLAATMVQRSQARIEDKLALNGVQALTAYAIAHGLTPAP